jgi:hypothetical protein
MDNYYEFAEEDPNSAKATVEDSMPPEIPIRSQLEEINEYIIKNICRENNLANISYLNLFNNKIKVIHNL